MAQPREKHREHSPATAAASPRLPSDPAEIARLDPARLGPSLARFQDLAAYIAANPAEPGKIYCADNLWFQGVENARVIPGVPGLSPFGIAAGFRHFGAVGDAVADPDGIRVAGTDDKIAVQAALDWKKVGRDRTLSGRPGDSYRVSEALVGTGDFDLDLGGARIVSDSNTRVIDWSATLFGPHRLSADYAPGSLSIDLTDDPLPEPPRRGTVIKILSDGVDPANRDNGSRPKQFRTGEFFFVDQGSTTTRIKLQRPLRFTVAIDPVSTKGDEPRIPAYTTALNARIVYADTQERFRLTDGQIRYQDGNEASWSGPALRISGFVNPLVDRVEFNRGYGPGVRLLGTYGATVRDCSFRYLEDNIGNRQFGYGVADAGWNTLVIGQHGNHCRHVYTSSVASIKTTHTDLKALIAVGRTVGAQIIGGHASGGVRAHWDTHHSTDGATFSDVYSEGGLGRAVGIRGRDVSLSRPRIRNQQSGIKFFTGYQGGDPDDDLYLAGKTPDDFTSGFCESPDVVCDFEPFVSERATVSLSGEGRYTSNDHCGVYCNGGQVTVTGLHNFSVAPGSVPHDRAGCIHVNGPSKGSDMVFPKTRLTIDGIVVIDARRARVGTVTGMVVNANAELIVRGRLRLLLPTGAGYRSGRGTIRCEGDGVIEISVENAADNTLIDTANALVHQRVRSLDGSVRWDDASDVLSLADRPLFQTYRSPGIGLTHSGTGAEVRNVYTPPGQFAFYALNTRGQGQLRCILTGQKTGANGPARLMLQTAGGTLVDAFDIPQNHVDWQLEVTLDVTDVHSQVFTSRFFAFGNGDALEVGSLSRKEIDASPKTAESPAFVFGVMAVPGDSLGFGSVETWATAGGRF